MKRYFEEDNGFALVLTILVIGLLAALTIRFNIEVRTDLYAAEVIFENIKAGYIAKSGFNYALAVLYKDAEQNDFDSLSERWRNEAALFSKASSMFKDGRFELEIKDHSGRININRLIDSEGNYNKAQKALLKAFFSSEQFGLWPEEVDCIIDAIKDWVDPDDRGRMEKADYQNLQESYFCRNGPMMFVEEMLFIRGVTRKLFYGTKDSPGISTYLTTLGDGRININTADPLILKALMAGAGQDLIEDMVTYRADAENDLTNPGWYKKFTESEQINIDPSLVTVSSEFFEICSRGFVGAVEKQFTGIVNRTKKDVQIISWKVDY